MKKKILSLLLSLVMCLSLVPSAYASDTQWSGIVSDQNMTFCDSAAVLADGTMKAWYIIDLDGKAITAERHDLVTVGTGYKAIAGDANLLKENGVLDALDNPNLYNEIFHPGISDVAQISGQYAFVLKNDGSAWKLDEKLADNVKQIAAGDAMFILKNDGSLWSANIMSENTNPALGRDQGKNGDTLGKVMDNVAYVTDCMAIKTDGTLWTWGSRWSVGNGTSTDVFTPVKLMDNVVGAWSYTYLFRKYRFALTADGSLYSWGYKTTQDAWDMGYERTDSQDVYVEEYFVREEHPIYYQSRPRKVDVDDVVSVYAVPGTLLVQKSDGSLWAMGDVGKLPCRTGSGDEEEIVTVFRKVMDSVKLSPKVAAAKAAAPTTPTQNTQTTTTDPTTQPTQPDDPETPAKGKLVTGSLDMPQLSKQEVIDLLKENPMTFSGQVFDSQPNCTAPYASGKLSDAYLQAALDRLNALRRLVGMPATQLDKSWCEYAQHGAVVMGAIGKMTHTPSQPAGMDRDFYNKGYAATQSGSINYWQDLITAVDRWMADSNTHNIDRVGHRRWQLSPTLDKVGFGYVENGNGSTGKYTVEKNFDLADMSVGHSVNYDSFGWPSAGYFPNDIIGFQADTPWSVSLNPDIYAAPNGITVRLSGGGRNWTFSGRYTPSDEGAYLTTTPANSWDYGNNHCIIFRPDGVDKYEGVYTVEIQGLTSKKDRSPIPFTYQVEFFSMSQAAGTPTNSTTPANPATPTNPTTPQNPTASGSNPFTDVPSGAYYTDAVLWAYQNNITSGTTATTFEPYSACTRGQVVTFLWRAQGKPEPKTTVNPFRDVKASDYYYKAVLWAYENGITAGTTAAAFSPNQTCTNGHVVTFLWRANGEPAANGTSSLAGQFRNNYYTTAVAWADTTGLLKDTGTAFDPAAQSPRANIVTYLYRDSTK